MRTGIMTGLTWLLGFATILGIAALFNAGASVITVRQKRNRRQSRRLREYRFARNVSYQLWVMRALGSLTLAWLAIGLVLLIGVL